MRADRVGGVVAALALGCASLSPAATNAQADHHSPAIAGPAPEFPRGLDWLNVSRPLTMADLRGKIVLLDFWTYGCINCIHIIPDLERLQQEYPRELVVIGVHSAKYPAEAVTKSIREVIQRYGITHPVVNDSDFQTWDLYGATAWPTLVLVDPGGTIADRLEGEGVYAWFKPRIQELVDRFSRTGLLDERALSAIETRPAAPDSVLSYPGKVLADAAGGRLLIADTSHNRIVVADFATGNILAIAGSGRAGLRDGSFSEAELDQPQGMALASDGHTLYVADTGNHAVRIVDLRDRTVVTFAGDGRQAPEYPPEPGPAGSVELSSPWDLALVGTRLFIAMAGSHQVWVADLAARRLEPFAGIGTEGTFDGPRLLASLAQPSGLAWDGGSRLYIASAEGNSVRWVDLGEPGAVHTLAGGADNLFDFGSTDGPALLARFQHPLGVCAAGGSVYVADTYNNRIRRIDPATGTVTTLAGGAAGWRDGPDPLFYEPGGLAAGPEGQLVVADTNNLAVRLLDRATGSARTLVLLGIERYAFAGELAGGAGGELAGPGPGVKALDVPAVTLAPGDDALELSIELPPGYEVNPQAPFSMQWSVIPGPAGHGGVDLGHDASRSVVIPRFPLLVPFTASSGSGTLVGELTVVYCREDETGVCLLERVRVAVPYTVGDGGARKVPIAWQVPPPRRP